jgi:hypothetical protein
MLWMIATFASSAIRVPPSTGRGPVQRIEVSARIGRGAEASERGKLEHQANRIRTVVDKLPDGREVYVTVLDFE